MKRDKIGPSDIWKQAQGEIIVSVKSYLVFDDTVADKNASTKIGLVRRQWSGNRKQVIRGIGMVNCVYVNPDLNLFWIIDFRVYDMDGDGKTKLDHVQDMLDNAVTRKKLPFVAVLMDTWYAKMEVMKRIEALGKMYYCPLQHNRRMRHRCWRP